MKRAAYNPIGYFIAACVLMTLPFVVNAQTGPVNYTVTLDNKPNSHLVHIALSVSAGGAPSVDVVMPAWSPWAYSIHNACRYVQEFSAGDEKGTALRFEKIDKQTWRIYPQEGRVVAAHEFFHLWNVKRIRPVVLGPFDYSREQNTRNLYVSEGMTSYWAAIGLK